MSESEHEAEMARKPRGRWKVLSRFVIGKQDNPMMTRWRVIQTPWFGLYVHFIYREDLDPVPHDHPWVFWRMVLRGGYMERYFTDPQYGRADLRVQTPWRPSRVPVEHAHRITHVEPKTTTLVIVGPKHHAWGFWGPDPVGAYLVGARRWVPWQDALGIRPTEGVASGDVRLRPEGGA